MTPATSSRPIAKAGHLVAGRDPDRASAGRTTALSNRDATAASADRSKSSFPRAVASAASTSRPSARTPRIRTRPSCGWSILYSDEGQNLWLKGYCHPIRYEDLVAKDKVPAELLAKLPDVDRGGVPLARSARRGEQADHR